MGLVAAIIQETRALAGRQYSFPALTILKMRTWRGHGSMSETVYTPAPTASATCRTAFSKIC